MRSYSSKHLVFPACVYFFVSFVSLCCGLVYFLWSLLLVRWIRHYLLPLLVFQAHDTLCLQREPAFSICCVLLSLLCPHVLCLPCCSSYLFVPACTTTAFCS